MKILSSLILSLVSITAFAGSYGDYESMIKAAAEKYGIDPGIYAAQIQQESGFNPGVCSHKGACGLAQIMPGTARELGVKNREDPAQSLDGGAKYLSQQLHKYNGDYVKALAAYNAGPGAVDKYGGVPPYKETQNYVKAIMANAGKYGADPNKLTYDPSKVDLKKYTGNYLIDMYNKYLGDGNKGYIKGEGNTGSHFFEELFYKIDKNFKEPITTFGTKLSGSLTTSVTLLATVSLILYLLMMAFGLTKISLGPLVMKYFVIGAVITFAISFDRFMFYLGNSLLDFGDNIIVGITGNFSAGQLLDEFMSNAKNIVHGFADKIGIMSPSSWLFGIITAVAFVALVAYGAAAFVSIAIAKITMYILLPLAPIFIVAILFKSTLSFFSAWVSFLVGASLTQVVAALLLRSFTAISANTTSSTDFSFTDAMSYVVILGVGILLFSLVPTLVRGVTGQVSLGATAVGENVMRNARSELNRAGNYFGGRGKK